MEYANLFFISNLYNTHFTNLQLLFHAEVDVVEGS